MIHIVAQVHDAGKIQVLHSYVKVSKTRLIDDVLSGQKFLSLKFDVYVSWCKLT